MLFILLVPDWYTVPSLALYSLYLLMKEDSHYKISPMNFHNEVHILFTWLIILQHFSLQNFQTELNSNQNIVSVSQIRGRTEVSSPCSLMCAFFIYFFIPIAYIIICFCLYILFQATKFLISIFFLYF